MPHAADARFRRARLEKELEKEKARVSRLLSVVEVRHAHVERESFDDRIFVIDHRNKPKQRRCMICSAEFMSSGAGNRLCGRCRRNS